VNVLRANLIERPPSARLRAAFVVAGARSGGHRSADHAPAAAGLNSAFVEPAVKTRLRRAAATATLEPPSAWWVCPRRKEASMFARRKPAPLSAAARMGFRSKLVLMKLGHDLREQYDPVLEEELPDDLADLAARLNPVAPLRPS
jgi:hypothetical protein